MFDYVNFCWNFIQPLLTLKFSLGIIYFVVANLSGNRDNEVVFNLAQTQVKPHTSCHHVQMLIYMLES